MFGGVGRIGRIGRTPAKGGGSLAAALLSGQAAGFAYSGLDQSVYVKGHTTNPRGDANDILAYVSPSTKYVRNSAGILVPGTTLRTDHNVSGTALGLLVEASRTNLFQRSEEFDNAYWTKAAVSVSANAAVAPDGETTMDTITGDGTSNTHGVRRQVSGGSGLTLSAVFRKGSDRYGTLLMLGRNPTADPGCRIQIDLQTNSIVETGGGVTSAELIAFGSGLIRARLTRTAAWGTSTDTECRIETSSTATYLINTTTGFQNIWGAQIEAGATASSIIKTTSASVTRAADAVNIPLADIPWNAGAGTLTLNGSPVTPTTDGTNLNIAATAIAAGVSHIESMVWIPS